MAKGASRCDLDKAGGLLIKTYTNNVFINNKQVAVLGTKVKPHGPGVHSVAKMIEASNTVMAGNLGVVRKDHKANCGHKSTGSENVFIG